MDINAAMLVNEIKAVIGEISGGIIYPDLINAIDQRAALTSPAKVSGDSDNVQSRAAFREYDRKEIASTRTSWQIWRDACTWQARAALSADGGDLNAEQVEWVVNDNAELGVKIGQPFFWLYKGASLVYEDALHDDGSPMHWRPIFKREFGECAHPINYTNPELIGTVSLDDGKKWKRLPAAKAMGK